MPRTKHKDSITKQMEKRSDKKGAKNNEADAATNSGQAYIPTGSTLLNLALSDKWNGGWPCGKISNLIGDSSSGKTFLAITAFAEMSCYPRFDKYRRIFDDVEAANEFDMDNLFGSKTAELIEGPGKNGESSNSIQDLEVNVNNALDEGEPFLYIEDSFDALTSEEEIGRTEARVEAANKGKSVDTGTYGMEKAKAAGAMLRQIKTKLQDSASSLIIISQTRDNIGIGFAKKTRSGGKALKFYSTHEIWTAVGGQIKRKDVSVGVLCKIKVSKNKITGKVREVSIPIYYDYGIDDIESCIDYMVENKFWGMTSAGAAKGKRRGAAVGKKQGGRTIDAVDLGIKATKEKLIRMIEEQELETELSKIVGKYWNEFEKSIKTDRKRKYD